MKVSEFEDAGFKINPETSSKDSLVTLFIISGVRSK